VVHWRVKAVCGSLGSQSCLWLTGESDLFVVHWGVRTAVCGSLTRSQSGLRFIKESGMFVVHWGVRGVCGSLTGNSELFVGH
jgi:hypothetical protein